MDALQLQLKRITDKLQQAAQRYQLLQKEHEQLNKEVQLLREKEKARQIRMDELEMKITALQTVTGQLTEAEKKDVEKRINRYIREIDRCIALLSE
jgi:ABC-type iron transport system FetAB ATPase subunit